MKNVISDQVQAIYFDLRSDQGQLIFVILRPRANYKIKNKSRLILLAKNLLKFGGSAVRSWLLVVKSKVSKQEQFSCMVYISICIILDLGAMRVSVGN